MSDAQHWRQPDSGSWPSEQRNEPHVLRGCSLRPSDGCCVQLTCSQRIPPHRTRERRTQRKRRLATLKEGANLWQQLHRCAAALAPTARRKVAKETCFSAGFASTEFVPFRQRSSTLRRATPFATESCVLVAAAPLGTLASVILNYELPDVQWQHGRSYHGLLRPFSPVYSARPVEIVTAHHTPMHAAIGLRADADLLPHRQRLLVGGCILDGLAKQIDQSTCMGCGIIAEHLPYLDEIQDSARQIG